MPCKDGFQLHIFISLFAIFQILSSPTYQCGVEALTVAAMLSVQNVFIFTESRAATDRRKREFAVYEGDHLTLINSIHQFNENF